MKKILQELRSERGSVESAMVIVPLVILFLIGMQLALSAHSRNMQRIFVQDGASIRSITGSFDSTDRFLHIESSGDGQNLDLLISHQSAPLVAILPTLSELMNGSPIVDLSGISIVENQR